MVDQSFFIVTKICHPILQLKTCPNSCKSEMGGWSTIHFYLNNGWATIPKINDGRPYLILDCNWSQKKKWFIQAFIVTDKRNTCIVEPER